MPLRKLEVRTCISNLHMHYSMEMIYHIIATEFSYSQQGSWSIMILIFIFSVKLNVSLVAYCVSLQSLLHHVLSDVIVNEWRYAVMLSVYLPAYFL